MKKILGTIVLASCAAVADVPPSPVAHGPTMEQRLAKRKKVTPELQMQKFGGFVTAEYNGRYCYFVNAQKRVGLKAFEFVQGQIQQVLSLPSRVEECVIEGNDNFAPLRHAWSGDRPTGAVVSVIDIPGWTSLLIAPEDGWAQINIAALAKDNPSADLLEKRLIKELWRAYIVLFGGGNARLAGDLMNPITSLSDLDSKPKLAPCPEPFNTVIEGARARGINCVRRATYKQACVEGWAPAPTNEFQKAIWDDIHKLPSDPIVIKPEAKPVKE